MPRGPRLDARGALHHVMVRGIERRALFITDADPADFVCRLFVERLLVQAAAGEPSRGRTSIDARQLVQAVAARVAEEMGMPIECLFNGRRTRTIVAHRALVCFVVVHAGGLALRTVAEILGVSAPTVMRGVRRGPEILRRTGLRADALLP